MRIRNLSTGDQPMPSDQFQRSSEFRAAGHWGDLTLPAVIDVWADSGPDHPFISDGTHSLTYGEFRDHAWTLAANLAGLGIRRGDRVVVQLPNWNEFPLVYAACARLGAVTIPVVVVYRHDEVGFIVENSGAVALITCGDFGGFDHAAMAADIAASSGHPVTQVVVRPSAHTKCARVFSDLLTADAAAQDLPEAPSADDQHLILYTSGTESRPKGCLHTWNTVSFLANQAIPAMGMTRADTMFMPSPVGHALGLALGIVAPALAGASVHLLDIFDPPTALERISTYRCTGTASTAPFIQLMLDAYDPAVHDVSGLRFWFTAGAPVPATLVEDAARRFSGCRVVSAYGSSEVMLATVCSPGDSVERVASSDGRPITGVELRIVVDDKTAPTGVDGEIRYRGPGRMLGYWGRPDLTDDAIDDDGWWCTGDVGHLDETGYLRVTGRIKEIIIRGGFNISAREVEEALLALPGIARVSIIGLPDPVVGERVCAVVEPADGHQPPTLRQLRDYLVNQHRMAVWKAPERLEIVATWPTTATGKVQKFLLRQHIIGSAALAIEQTATSSDEVVDHVARLDESERVEAVLALIGEEVAEVLGLPSSSEVPADRRLGELGLESLTAVSLRDRLAARIGVSLPASLLFDYPTPRALAEYLVNATLRPASSPQSSPSVSESRAMDEPIAIVSMACRLPGGIADPDQLWNLLAAGGDAIGPFPADRWDVEALYDPDPDAVGRSSAREGGFLPRVDTFDARLFGITPREATSMDPQQRLLLETTWEALERGGIVPASLAGSATGVYIGMIAGDYLAGPSLEQLDGYTITGSTLSVASGRLAYTLGLNGPAITVDTACSSSLLAVHLAASGLRTGDCDMALVGGATVMTTPRAFVEFSRLRGLSPSGRCRSFSDDADGTGLAEGVVMVVLKRLSDAQRDGDEILALLRGTAANQDGRSQGLSAPVGPAQEKVIRSALQRSGLAPADIDYVEAHGTGTMLGDPIEANALSQVFGPTRTPGRPLYIGSLKSNVGHTQAAAGLAGMMKVVLSLRNSALPATLHADRPTRHIDWDSSGMRLVRKSTPWPREDQPRRAGVSAFGISGTNVHVVVEEAPSQLCPSSAGPPSEATRLFLVSGRTDAALRRQGARLAGKLVADPTTALDDLAYTLARHRTHFERRAGIVARTHAEVLSGLDALSTWRSASGLVLPPSQEPIVGKVAFVVPGHSSRWPGMGTELLAQSPVFADALARFDDALRPHTGWSVTDLLRGSSAPVDVDQVEVIHATLFAMDCALAELWRSIGVRPDGVIGHSLGEIAAARIAGALSVEQAATVAAVRGLAMRQAEGAGGALSVELAVERITSQLEDFDGRLTVAAVNTGRSTTVSGDLDALAALQERLDAAGIAARRVPVPFASHSHQMDPVADELRRVLFVASTPTAVPLYSTVLGERVTGEIVNAEYWARNVREPVQFAATVRRMLDDGYRYFVEVSPHPTLSGAIRTVAADAGVQVVTVNSLRRDQGGVDVILRELAQMTTAGYDPDWSLAYPLGTEIAVPTYAFDQERFWAEPASRAAAATTTSPFVDTHIEDSDVPGRHVVQADIDLRDSRFATLADHRIDGTVWMPAAAFLEIALEASDLLGELRARDVTDVRFERPLELPGDEAIRVQLVVSPEGPDGERSFTISARRPGMSTFERHVTGHVATTAGGEPAEAPGLILERCAEEVDVSGLYAALDAAGIEYGPAFRLLEAGWRDERFAVGRLTSTSTTFGGLFDPALLDAAFHVAALPRDVPTGRTFVPATIDRIRLGAMTARPMWVTSHVRSYDDRSAVLDLRLFDKDQQLVLEIDGFEVVKLAEPSTPLYEVRWTARPVAEVPAARETWLIFADDCEVGEQLGQRLGTEPHVIVRRSSAFTVEGEGRYRLDPADPDHLAQLFNDAFADIAPGRIIVLSSLDAPAIDSAESAAEAARLTCTSLAYLVQVVTSSTWSRAPRLFIITEGSQAAGGSNAVTRPEQALAWGFGTAIGQEYPELKTTLVDMESTDGIDALWSQLWNADDEPWVALRENGRCVPRLVPTRLSGKVVPPAADRTHLVTGGLGGLGRVAADRLVSLGARHLAVLGRSEPSEEATEWLRGLRGRGIEVHVLHADVADRESLAAALDMLRHDAPPIGGIVHAAGVVDDAIVAGLTPERTARVLAPKVLGTALLTELVPESDFLVLFSSAAGLLGSAGQSAYSAANAFLDAWAHHLAGARRAALSLDWGAWSDVGMVAQAESRAANVRRMGLVALTPQQGGDLFVRALGSNRRQLAPLILDIDELRTRPELIRSRPMLSEITVGPRDVPPPRQLAKRIHAAVTADERSALLETYLCSTVAAITASRISDISVTKPLKELDLDSLMRVTLNNTVSRDLSIRLPSRAALSASDIRSLADMVMVALATQTNNGDSTASDELDSDDAPTVIHRPATRDVIRLLRSEQRGTPAATHAIGFAVRLSESVTSEKLSGILARLTARHAALRTAIVVDAEEGMLLETRQSPTGRLLTWTAVDGAVNAEERLHALLNPPFDLARSPLWRFELLDSASGQVLIYGAHHAVSDAASLLLIMAEISAELSGTRLSDTASNRDIDRLLRAQAPANDRPHIDRRAEFTGCRRLDLALSGPRPAVRSYRAGGVTIDIPGGLVAEVATRAARLAITPAAVCLGTLTVFLARLRRRNKFVLAVPVDTRIHADALGAIGYFGVPIPFPTEVGSDEPIAEVLRRTDDRLARVLEQGESFVDAMSALVDEGLHRENAPLIEVYFNYLRSPGAAADGVELLRVGPAWSDLDLMVTVAPDLGQLWLDYNVDILDAATCTELGHDYLRLLAGVADGSATTDPALPHRRSAVAVAASFALGNLAPMIGAALDDGTEVLEAPYHQVLAALYDPSGVFADPASGAGVVLLRASDLQRFGSITDDLLTDLAEDYPAALRAFIGQTGKPLVVALLPDRTADDRLREWVRQVAERIEGQPSLAVLGPDYWQRKYPGAEVFDPETDRSAHLPYRPEFQAAVALTLADVLRALNRPSPKVIAVDGDDTLWTGVAGEHGPDGVDLTGPRTILARRLLDWRDAGVLLVLVSNNDDSTVREVLARPDSLLRAEHFSIISANWDSKPARLQAAAAELGLGLDSFVFLDDNPIEVAAMRSALPEVLCVTTPPPEELDEFIRRLWPAPPVAVTREDVGRAEFYRVERIRGVAQQQLEFGEFLEQLELHVDVDPLNADTVARSVQLSRRTNQFNMRPVDLDETTLTRWQQDGEVWTASARDRFGDYGQIGLLVVHLDGDILDVTTWMLSCRALGRGVEERLLEWLANRAESLGCSTVRLVAEHTQRNIPARRLVSALSAETDVELSRRQEVQVTPRRLRSFRSWDARIVEREGQGRD